MSQVSLEKQVASTEKLANRSDWPSYRQDKQEKVLSATTRSSKASLVAPRPRQSPATSTRPKEPRTGPLGADEKLYPLSAAGTVAAVGGLVSIGIHPAVDVATFEMDA